MIRLQQLFILCALGLATVTAQASELGPSMMVQTHGPVRVGQALPSFAGWTPEGVRWSTRDAFKGASDSKGLIISFFATVCQPCLIGIPKMQRVLKERQGYDLLLVAYGEKAAIIQPFMKHQGWKDKTVLDPYKTLGGRLGVQDAIPRTFVVDKNGTVQAIFETEGDDFEQKLSALLAP